MKDFKIQTNNHNDSKSIIKYYKKDFHEKINKYFQRSSIIDLVTKYELYYHISLGNYAFETILNINETSEKLQEINLTVSPVKALYKIYGIIEEYINEKDFEKKLELHIKKEASLQALNDFIRKDNDFIGKKYYKQQKTEDIENDIFFNEIMQINFESNYLKTYVHYDLVLTDKFLEDIQNKIFTHKKELI